MLICILCLSCTKTNSRPINANQFQTEKKIDYFEKKMKCASLIEKTKNRFDKENKEAIDLSVYGRSKQYQTMILLDVCYSKKLNTCVGFTVEITRRNSKKMFEVFSALDLLTNSPIETASLDYDSDRKRNPSNNKGIRYFQDQRVVRSNVSCVE